MELSADTSSQNSQWGLLPQNALRQSSSPSRSPSGQHDPSSSQHSPPTMITPMFYDPSQVTSPDGGDYQEWVNSYYNNTSQAQFYPHDPSSSSLSQMPFDPSIASVQHPSTQSHMTAPGAMPVQWANQYPVVPSHYMNPVGQHSSTDFVPSYPNARPPNRIPPTSATSQPIHRVNNRQGQYAPSVHDVTSQLPPSAAPTSNYPPHSLSVQPMVSAQADHEMPYYHPPTGIDPPPPPSSHVPQQNERFHFQFQPIAPEPNFQTHTGTNSTGTPSSDHTRLSQTPPSHSTTDDARAGNPGNSPVSSKTNGVPLRPRPSPARTAAKGKAAKRQRAIESESESDEDDGFSAPRGAVPPLKGPDSNAQRLYVALHA